VEAAAEGSSELGADGGTVVGVGEGGGVGVVAPVRLSEAVAVGVVSTVSLVVPDGVMPPVVVAGRFVSGCWVGVGLVADGSVVGVLSGEAVGLVAGRGR
jgi:hypothetical protein